MADKDLQLLPILLTVTLLIDCCFEQQRRSPRRRWADERSDGRDINQDPLTQTVGTERRLSRLLPLPRARPSYNWRWSTDLRLQVVHTGPSGTSRPGDRLQSSGVEHVVVNRRRRDHVTAWVAVLPPGASAQIIIHWLEHYEPAGQRPTRCTNIPGAAAWPVAVNGVRHWDSVSRRVTDHVSRLHRHRGARPSAPGAWLRDVQSLVIIIVIIIIIIIALNPKKITVFSLARAEVYRMSLLPVGSCLSVCMCVLTTGAYAKFWTGRSQLNTQ